MAGLTHMRENPRVNRILLTAIEQYTEAGELTDEILGRTLDVSEGGMKVEMKRPLPLLSTVTISLAFKDDIIHVDGQIVHLVKNDAGLIDTGIMFTSLSSEQRKILKANLGKTT